MLIKLVWEIINNGAIHIHWYFPTEMSRIIDDAKNAQFKIKEQIKILSDVLDLSFTMTKEDTSNWRITVSVDTTTPFVGDY